MKRLEPKAAGMAAVAGLIKASGRVQGRVRIQKTIYLLWRMGVLEVENLRFRYEEYGPCSVDLADALLAAINWGVVHELFATGDEWQEVAYTAGDKLDLAVNLLSQESCETLNRLAKVTSHEHWRSLELAATIDYFTAREHLAHDIAVERALRLKPACAAYRQSALNLLGRLQLPVQTN